MKTIFSLILILSFFQINNTVWSQSDFYALDTIQKIEIYFSQPDWDYEMDTSKSGSEGYIMADSVIINGFVFDSVGVKYKGNSSYNSSYTKNPFHISLNEYKSNNYLGYKDIKLGNGYSDPSMIREVLAYSILGNYMDSPRSNFAQLYINANYIGVYSNEESINKKFCTTHFNSNNGIFVKCNPLVNPGPTTKSNLKLTPSTDSSDYYNFYEMKSDYGWNELMELMDSVTNGTSDLGTTIDMDRVIWMLAFNNVLVNLDSYSGVFCQNFYLYKDQTNRFNPIIWDLNMSFGGFPYLGSGTSSMGTLSNTNMVQLSPTIHSGDSNWPLINDVLNNPTYKRMYIAHMKTISSEFFSTNAYETLAGQLQSVIDTAVQSDLNNFYGYTDFQNGLTANTVVGSYTVPGISNLMDSRVSFLDATTEFSYTSPLITSVSSSDATPAINSQFTITATVTNTNIDGVYLGYRFGSFDKFNRIAMYDDGLHNDGVSGDNVFGVSLSMLDNEGQYYVYAENDNAGMFSPQRAEHEFYSIYAETSLTENSNSTTKQELSIYPNPANDYFTVELSDDDVSEITLLDSRGQVIEKRSFSSGNEQLFTTENLTPGFYFLKVISKNNHVLVGKICLQK